MSETELKLKKSQELLSAINNNDEFKLIELRKYDVLGSAEMLIVEVTCDGVPDRNKFGFNYRERLALVVFSENNDLPLVLPLRDDFPVVAHMNSPMMGLTRTLCLYFEPITSVLRTWTSEKFLRRILWWIENTSTNQLHLSDQPLEQMFFNTQLELVLPNNLEDLLSDNADLIIKNAITRKNGSRVLGETLIVDINNTPNPSSAKLIVLSFPAIVHGEVEFPSRSMTELFSTLENKGLDPLNTLYNQLEKIVSDEVKLLESSITATVILTCIPLKRTENSNIEKIEQKAYWIEMNPIQLGIKFDAFISHDGQYYFDTLNKNKRSINEVELIEIFPMEVIYKNKKIDYRTQSGLTEEGPRGALIGVGAIGSVLFEHWSRCGWGEWDLIDKDHIKPHNLTRHTAWIDDIGMNKVDSVARGAFFNTGLLSDTSRLAIDATKVTSEEMKNLFSECEFIVDASTTLEYPRTISFLKNAPRHCSTFLTPNGNNSVLLVEDKERKTTLCSLESQYYKAIINNLCGENHLEGNLGNFWSGASCRDISLKLPYSKITVHTANLSEQIMHRLGNSESSVNVWSRHRTTGAVTHYDIPVYDQVIEAIGDKKVIYDNGLKEKLIKLREHSLPNETGGYLVGYHDFTLDAIFIVDAISAPIDSVSSTTKFARGVSGVFEDITKIRLETAEIVDYIGEWHSHPKGCSATPSDQDFLQLADLATKLSNDGFSAISLIIGDDDDLSILIGKIK